MPLGIFLDIWIGIPYETTQRIYPGTSLEITYCYLPTFKEITYAIYSEIPVWFRFILSRVISPEIYPTISPKISSRISPVIPL